MAKKRFPSEDIPKINRAVGNTDKLLIGKNDTGETVYANVEDLPYAKSSEIANLVTKVPGKGLSTLDFTAQDKAIVNSAVSGEEFYRFISNSNYADQMVIERAAYDSKNAIKAEAIKTAQNIFIADDAILKLITEINARSFGLEIFMNQFLLTDEFEIILDDNENPIITNEFQASFLNKYILDEYGYFIFDEFNNLITY
jgi:hypothetical protein